MSKKWLTLPIAVAALAIGAVAAFASTNSSSSTAMPNHASMHVNAAAKPTAADLRVTLDRLLGEHAQLAVAATRAGLNGSSDFNAIAKSLDANSVDLANAIGSLYGAKARNQFLNSKFGWRAHIGFFVDYTVATAKGDKAGQTKAVNNLKGYIGASASFFNGATGVPTKTLVAGLTEHIMQLKDQVDAYHAKRYAKAAALTRASYEHMFMLGDALAAGIAKKFPQKFA
ncbi:MAG: hypothetical protein ACXWYS_00715 [Gaiellaceae bacterium]